jgi:hypothetical protein
MTQFEPSPDAVAWFLSLGRFQAISLLLIPNPVVTTDL